MPYTRCPFTVLALARGVKSDSGSLIGPNTYSIFQLLKTMLYSFSSAFY